jgi:glyoxylase-like metal-dependent hydrolase (beta-lactamase superfamily II)
MPNYICTACGVQYQETERPPEHCRICEDERQYVNWEGQAWTSLPELREGHRNNIKPAEPGLTEIGSEPSFAIGQRALLIQAPGGNILWDCISLIDDATINAIRSLGGISAIAISHPHFYSSMVEWSRAFDNAPIYLHAADRDWVMRPDPAITFWKGKTTALGDGLTLIHCGGHFEGSTVMHWAAAAEGRGALLTGDTITVVPDRRFVSFMRSYPNLIPLPAAVIRGIVQAVAPFRYDRIYGGWFDRVVRSDGREALERSAARYLEAIGA